MRKTRLNPNLTSGRGMGEGGGTKPLLVVSCSIAMNPLMFHSNLWDILRPIPRYYGKFWGKLK